MTKNGARQNYVNRLITFQSEAIAQCWTSIWCRPNYDYHQTTASSRKYVFEFESCSFKIGTLRGRSGEIGQDVGT